MFCMMQMHLYTVGVLKRLKAGSCHFQSFIVDGGESAEINFQFLSLSLSSRIIEDRQYYIVLTVVMKHINKLSGLY